MRRRALLAFVVIAVLGAVGLVVAGASDKRATAFSLEVPTGHPALVLHDGQRACQGPVRAQAAFRGLELWVKPVRPPGTRLLVRVVSGAGSRLASGAVHAAPAAAAALRVPVAAAPSTMTRVGLDQTIRAGQVVSFCFENAGPSTLTLAGAPAEPGSGNIEAGGHTYGLAAATVLLKPHASSVLSLLPTIFARAALFRPTWMGAWTYWLLLGLLAAAFPLAGWAVALASREEPSRSARAADGVSGGRDAGR